MDFLNISSVPYSEPCVQVGNPYYKRIAKIECRVFADQIKRYYPKAAIKVQSFPHDFGNYLEVIACFFDEDSANQAYAVESDALDKLDVWDEQSLKELEASKYPFNQIKQ